MQKVRSLKEVLAAFRDKNVQELNLCFSSTVEGAKHIADALKHNTTLKTLDLGHNFICDKGAKHIAEALKHNTTLTTLSLEAGNIFPKGAKHIADALEHNTTLATLNLQNNKIGADGVRHVAEALKQNTTLKTLDLGHSYIGDEGAKHVAEALKHNTTLTTVNLERNYGFTDYFGVEGAKHIADALKHNTTLTTLSLGYNQIGAEGAKHIADALKHNTTLTILDLRYNDIGDKGAKHVAEALKHNTTLTTLNLQDNYIGDEPAEYVHNAINESIAARRRLFQWPKPPVNRKKKHSSSEDPAHLTKSKSIEIECSVCLEQKDQLHLLPCLHSVCEQCVHDITAISPSICRECQEPFPSTFLPNNVVDEQTRIYCPQHTANNATTFCSDCNVLVCLACEHDASHHLYELDEAIKKMQIDLPPILDDLLVQLEQVNEAIEYIAFARLSAKERLASIKNDIHSSFEALNNQELASQRDALLEQAQAIADHQDKILNLQGEDLIATKDARETALQQARLLTGDTAQLAAYIMIRGRTNLLLKNLPELEPLVFDLLRFEQVGSRQVGRVFEYEPPLQVSYAKQVVKVH